MPLDMANWGFVGGDDEPPLVAKTLARRHPDVEFVLVGRNSGEDPSSLGFPANITNPWTGLRPVVSEECRRAGGDATKTVEILDHYTLEMFRNLDGLIVWTGQHGTSNSRIPKVGGEWVQDDLTNPQISFINYASYVVRGINAFRAANPLEREEIWLCPDARNYVKARDLKWPMRHPVLGQYNWSRMEKHERYNDTRTPEECGFAGSVLSSHLWHARHHYIYSRLEVCGVTPEHMNTEFGDWSGRKGQFGLFINEARAYVKNNRFDILRDWVLPLNPYFVHGKWPPERQQELGREITSVPFTEYYDKLRSVVCTLTTPTSGTGWATTKPWQSFATGTVCFFHPAYDTQGHVIPTTAQVTAGEVDHDEELKHLAQWLRVDSPEQLAKRVAAVSSSPETWKWLVTKQRQMYDQACEELRYAQLIEERLGLR